MNAETTEIRISNYANATGAPMRRLSGPETASRINAHPGG
jgi:hypothetical protein